MFYVDTEFARLVRRAVDSLDAPGGRHFRECHRAIS